MKLERSFCIYRRGGTRTTIRIWTTKTTAPKLLRKYKHLPADSRPSVEKTVSSTHTKAYRPIHTHATNSTYTDLLVLDAKETVRTQRMDLHTHRNDSAWKVYARHFMCIPLERVYTHFINCHSVAATPAAVGRRECPSAAWGNGEQHFHISVQLRACRWVVWSHLFSNLILICFSSVFVVDTNQTTLVVSLRKFSRTINIFFLQAVHSWWCASKK